MTSDFGGLHLDSAATQHTEAGTLLWLHCPMHRGQVTSAPSLPSMPDKERYRPRVFYLSMDFLLRTWPLSWKGTA